MASNANYTNFLTTGMIVNRASFTTGYSLVNSPLVQLNFVLARIQASQISSWCHIIGHHAFGGSYIYNGSVTQNGSNVFNPIQNPGRNTVVHIFGAMIVVQRAALHMGQLTVAAIKVSPGRRACPRGVHLQAAHAELTCSSCPPPLGGSIAAGRRGRRSGGRRPRYAPGIPSAVHAC